MRACPIDASTLIGPWKRYSFYSDLLGRQITGESFRAMDEDGCIWEIPRPVQTVGGCDGTSFWEEP